MDTLYLTAPSLAWEEQILAFKRESEATDPHLNGVGGLDSFDGVQEWLDYLALKSREETCPPDRVPDSTFLCVRQGDERLVGMINIRHRLNDFLLNYGGHIGYSIRPDERGKGYGKEQLRLGLAACRARGLHRVLLTCDQNNLRSRRTIESAGGVYEDSRTRPGEGPTRRYWIDIP